MPLPRIVRIKYSTTVGVYPLKGGEYRRLCDLHAAERKLAVAATGVAAAREHEGCQDCDDARAKLYAAD